MKSRKTIKPVLAWEREARLKSENLLIGCPKECRHCGHALRSIKALKELCPKAPKVLPNGTKILKKVLQKSQKYPPGMRLWAVSGKRSLISSFWLTF